MKKQILKVLLTVFAAVLSLNASAVAQSSWLDMKPLPNWNSRSRAILQTKKLSATDLAQCRNVIRPASLAVDRLLTQYNWTLFGEAQVYGETTIVTVATGFDGMCRPRGFETLVFVGNRAAGKLSPGPMDSRTDGYLTNVKLTTAKTLTAYYARYRATDALCCPWKTEAVTFVIKPDGANFLLTPEAKINVGAGNGAENQKPENTEALKNTIWRWQNAESATGKTTVEKPENYQLEFTNDNKVNVLADCNRGRGTYQTTGNELSFSGIFLTKMGCPPGSLDNRFLFGLESARKYRIEGDNLIIEAADGNGLMKFLRVIR